MIKRNTVQKMKIMSYMQNTKSHPTAEMVYAAVSKDLPAISLSTVYRNLNTMAEEGDLLKIEIGNEAHYDADLSLHHHAYCAACHRLYDVFDDDLSDFILQNVSVPNFMIDRAMLLVTGICSECGENERNA